MRTNLVAAYISRLPLAVLIWGGCQGQPSTGGHTLRQLVEPGCIPESDDAFCQRLGKGCGTVGDLDNCGQPRTVESCGACVAGQSCTAEGICACMPETD